MCQMIDTIERSALDQIALRCLRAVPISASMYAGSVSIAQGSGALFVPTAESANSEVHVPAVIWMPDEIEPATPSIDPQRLAHDA